MLAIFTPESNKDILPRILSLSLIAYSLLIFDDNQTRMAVPGKCLPISGSEETKVMQH